MVGLQLGRGLGCMCGADASPPSFSSSYPSSSLSSSSSSLFSSSSSRPPSSSPTLSSPSKFSCTVDRASSPSFQRTSLFWNWYANGGPVLCGVDTGFKGGAFGEVTSYSAGTCAGDGGRILNFRGRAGGGNVLAGRRLPILRRYGRFAGCLTPVCASFRVELEAPPRA